MKFFMMMLLALAIFLGCTDSKQYVAEKTEGYKPNLLLNKDNSFIFKVNLCQGIGTIKGNFTKSGDKVVLNVKERDFEGFSGDSEKVFTLTVVSRNELRFTSDVNVACGPKKGEIFTVK